MKREFKGIWIPAEIWTNPDLSWVEKIMLREIDSLQDENEGGCYASNGYFSEFFGLSKSRVSEVISGLVHRKYLRSLLVKFTERGQIKTRRILKTTGKGIRKTEAPPSEKRKVYSENRITPSGNGEYNNTGNNINTPPAPSSGTTEAGEKRFKTWLKDFTRGVKMPYEKRLDKECQKENAKRNPEDMH